MRPMCLALVLIVSVSPLLSSQDAWAEDPHVEIGILGTVSILMPKYGDKQTVVSVPNGANFVSASPGLRLAVWNDSPLLVEFGFGWITYEELTVTTLEGAIGGTSPAPRTKVAPFIQGVFGFVSASGDGGGSTESYAGGQGGIRYFFKPEVAGRLQIGYRHFLRESELGILEVGFGIGVFI